MNMINQVSRVYKDLDNSIARFQDVTGMHCPSGCAVCCGDWWVEATVLEVLPLGMEIYRQGQEQAVFSAIQEKGDHEDTTCVLYIADPLLRGKSACGYYPWRPLLCRLFGFAGRRNKLGRIEFSACRIIKGQYPGDVQRAEMGLAAGLKVPVYQDAFMRIASLDPGMGYRRLPINQAIKGALEYLYWMHPGGWGWKKAVGF
ncbi:MAG: YkgJ family cysteine cluster protein [Deltaproteobacteria bacterium]|nr:YkgJ family cysteine cluster protein [Deltaproteobacteria bacterium]